MKRKLGSQIMELDISTHVSGQIWKLEVSEGEMVSKEQIICTVECMKMEIPIVAAESGHLKCWHVSEQDSVIEGQSIGVLVKGV